MKYFFLSFAILSLTGCVTTSTGKPTPMAEFLFPSTCPGTRPEDPQFCKGETWTQIPNQPFEAQIRRARGETW